MTQSLSVIFQLVLGYGAIIFLSEFLYKKLFIRPEFTRKIAHILTTLISLLLLYKVENQWLVLFLGIASFAFLFISKKRGTFNSIELIGRTSKGSIYLPVSICFLYYISHYFQNELIFVLPMLILALSDPLAAICGIVLNDRNRKITILGRTFEKTRIGSLAFFLITFNLSVITLSYYEIAFQKSILLAITLAVTNTIVEILSSKGTDNLSVPFVSAFLIILFY